MDDNRYYNYLKGYISGSLKAQKEVGNVDESLDERGYILMTGIECCLELAANAHEEDYGTGQWSDEWNKQTKAYIEDTLGYKMSEREIGAYYGG